MPRGRKGKQRKRAVKPRVSQDPSIWHNFVLGSGSGCYVAHGEASWVIESTPFDPEEWDAPDSVPDLSLDPETMLLTAINNTKVFKSYFISFPYGARAKRNQNLKMGETTRDDGTQYNVITLILILNPYQVMDLCILEATCDMSEIELFSDIKELPAGWSFEQLYKPDNIEEREPVGPYVFPIGGNKEILCSQGNHGGFTHFYPQTRYAVDLEAPIGTPILAVADGEVVEIIQSNTVSGIHANNLFKWNSLVLKLDDGNFVEYVHIRTNSSLVSVGDQVTAGQQICETGNVGFCPTPHLHIQFHSTRDPDAPTIPFTFQDIHG
eukprot:CAMPEP_0206184178 /NCGR_PEP_ID=MMETSP0166-20121206/1069_1 /ASSEMBLY_ACC=CAM_ASM_000260 /TAXON_ID=95228 /ORGANISM="Vannella robusta, Strain DIVA3 518/3/11/1/6" /LENGTH=322 /DNA_ID=CAMNT_0053599155 /DNA_START=301 /DNA_END=1266 /DNA_ORIENTATION=+